MDEGKGIALCVLGIVALLAIVGLVLMFSQAGTTGEYVWWSEFKRGDGTPRRAGEQPIRYQYVDQAAGAAESSQAWERVPSYR